MLLGRFARIKYSGVGAMVETNGSLTNTAKAHVTCARELINSEFIEPLCRNKCVTEILVVLFDLIYLVLHFTNCLEFDLQIVEK